MSVVVSGGLWWFLVVEYSVEASIDDSVVTWWCVWLEVEWFSV